ncbi:polyprenyl synthetase family protein [Chloroflexota bacterium]
MWYKTYAKLLQAEIDTLLLPTLESTDLHELLSELVNTVRHQYGDGAEILQTRQWSLLPLIVCESISGDYHKSLPAAATLHLLNTAAEIFDDIEDADSSHSLLAKYGSAVAINTATALLILAEKSITQLKARGVEDAVTIRIMDTLNSYYTTACMGQHLDLTLSPNDINSEDTYFKITGMKSASTIECACHIGALVSNAARDLIDNYSQLGYNLGIAAQIANDIEGITGGRDIATQKITLPVIYALNHTTGESYDYLENMFIKQGDPLINVQKVIDILFGSGAIQYSILQMELYKQKVFDSLSLIERNKVDVSQLKNFLDYPDWN